MRGSLRFLFVLFPILGMVAPVSFGTTVTLQAGQSIQAAIDGATDGDEIVLEKGIYTGGITFRGKAVTVRSEEPHNRSVVLGTEIVGSQTANFVTFNQGEHPQSVLSGLKFNKYTTSQYIRIDSSSPTIENCIFRGCDYCYLGGGIECEDSSPIIRRCIFESIRGENATAIYLKGDSHPFISDCLFVKNWNYNDGGGIYIRPGSSATIVRCEFEENSAIHGGGILSMGVGTRVKNCIFRNNLMGFGPAIHCWNDQDTLITNSIFTCSTGSITPEQPPILCEGGSPVFENCTLAFNRSSSGNNAGVVTSEGDHPVFLNCILKNQGNEFIGAGRPIVKYSCVEGYVAETSFDFDPGFANDPNYLFTLRPDSLCVDAGDPETSFNDVCLPPGLGTSLNDIGAYGGPGNCLWEDYVTLRDPTATPTMTSTLTPSPTLTMTPTITKTITTTPTFRGASLEVHPGERIQAVIDSALNGDEIIVYPGVYYGALSIQGKILTIRSINPASSEVTSSTIIDARSQGPVLSIGTINAANCSIKGVTIRGGKTAYGSGLSILSSNVTLQNCHVVNNYCESPYYYGSEFGGGIYAKNSTVHVIDSLIQYNKAEIGGGLFVWGISSLDIEGCTISMNESIDSGGGISIEGSTSLKIIDTIISYNKSFSSGGLVAYGNRKISIVSSRILFNEDTRFAGGLSINSTSINIIDRTEVRGNISQNGAGGIRIMGNCGISGSSITNNQSTNGCGGFDFGPNGSLSINSSTVAGNRGKVCGGFGCSNTDHSSITNKVTGSSCIIWNEGNEIKDLSAVNLTFCCVEGGYAGEGNISVDPLFQEPGDYRLSAASPLIDSGIVLDATLDLDGFPRPYDVPGIGRDGTGDEYDLGAYEYPAGGNPIFSPTPTRTITQTPTITNTTTNTYTPTITFTPTITPTITQTPTPTPPRSVPIIYVSSIAEATPDGKTWQSAYHTVQAAIDSASGPVDIWIRMGRYREDVYLKDGIALYGGFQGIENVNEFSLRDPMGNQTRIQALFLKDVNGVILDGLSIIDESVFVEIYEEPNYHCPGSVEYHVAQFGNIDCRNSTLLCNNCYIKGVWIPESTDIFFDWYEGCGHTKWNNDGGGVYLSSSLAVFTNCFFISNRASGKGGGIFVKNNSSAYLYHCLLFGNRPSATVSQDNSSLEIYNSILRVNEGPPSGSNLVVGYCVTDMTCDGVGNMETDPQWVDPNLGDFRLSPNSPCIDQGTDKDIGVDYSGQKRPIDIPGVGADGTGTEFDIGPYEYQLGGNPTYTPTLTETISNTPTITDTPTATDTPTQTFTRTATPTATNTRNVPIIYVSSDSTGQQDGKSWNTAFQNLQAAFSSIDEPKDIWIKKGVYNECLLLENDVSIYGGFSGTEAESEFNLRDPRKHECVITTLRIWDTWNVYVEGVTISGASAPGGYIQGSTRHGYLDCRRVNVICKNCVIRDCVIPRLGNPDNYYGGDGAGIYLFRARGIFENCQITKNVAEITGGGIIAHDNLKAVFNHCLFASNGPTGIANWNSSDCIITNSIIWDNGWPFNGYGIVVDYSDVQGGYDRPGNINSDPLFVDSIHGNFHLLPGSPCIDTAAYSGLKVDLEGNPRPIDVPGMGADGTGEEYDMGPYEYVPLSPTDTPTLTESHTPTKSITETNTATPVPTETGTMTSFPIETSSATETPLPATTLTPSPTGTTTPSITLTQTETPTITPVPTTTCTPTPVPTIPGDVTQDEAVDAGDVIKILGAWHKEVGSASAEDINQDGGLDLLDLAILLQHWHVETGP